jgi:hypothetical protein
MMTGDLLAAKRRENIASYVISMWHIEDLVRACGFNVDLLLERLLPDGSLTQQEVETTRSWYAGIMHRMRQQGLERTGHLQEVEEVINELEYLHQTLADVLHDEEYERLLAGAKPGIETLQSQAGEDATGTVDTCFTAVYGVMLLRAQGSPVSEGTLEAEAAIRRLLERLSLHYRQMRKLPGVSMN